MNLYNGVAEILTKYELEKEKVGEKFLNFRSSNKYECECEKEKVGEDFEFWVVSLVLGRVLNGYLIVVMSMSR